ncbi:MAG: hypothetical protein AVDCRST_MAG23-735 [uncultured Sphingosinicella sp.]|uniref:Uncharacterized protein n=1 Tax=uncultured Sphingosinicella sp. TaxID=478748 RepID=A0A6J4TPR0_9SPHN|nr:MAG: hypothetical protein AVDCRST_MAG23-735 [uncultured Sphingosinicella sp.]
MRHPLAKRERAINLTAAACILVDFFVEGDALGYVALALLLTSIVLYINRTGSAF